MCMCRYIVYIYIYAYICIIVCIHICIHVHVILHYVVKWPYPLGHEGTYAGLPPMLCLGRTTRASRRPGRRQGAGTPPSQVRYRLLDSRFTLCFLALSFVVLFRCCNMFYCVLLLSAKVLPLTETDASYPLTELAETNASYQAGYRRREGRKAGRQAGRQADRQAGRQAGGRAGGRAGRKVRWAGGQEGRLALCRTPSVLIISIRNKT